jgi:hypothetical protein
MKGEENQMYVAQYELALLIFKDRLNDGEKRDEQFLYGDAVEPVPNRRRNVLNRFKRLLNVEKHDVQDVNDARPVHAL